MWHKDMFVSEQMNWILTLPVWNGVPVCENATGDLCATLDQVTSKATSETLFVWNIISKLTSLWHFTVLKTGNE